MSKPHKAPKIRRSAVRKSVPFGPEIYRSALEAAPNAFVMVNREGKIVLVNFQTEILFGHTREQLIGQEIEILVPQRFRAHHPAHRGTFMASPKPRAMGAGRDLFGLRIDGSEFPVEIGLNPIRTRQGLFVLASIPDIADRLPV